MVNVARGATASSFAHRFDRRHIERLKMPDIPEKEEGYDGHLSWNPADPNNLEQIQAFRDSVLACDKEKVIEAFETFASGLTTSQLEDMAEMVCDRRNAETTKEALLSAILLGSRPMVEFILSLFAEFPGEERCGVADSASFVSHMTPLMLACSCNNLAITECLLLRGHTLHPPCGPTCLCSLCRRVTTSSSVSLRRLDTFRAMASEAYLWLATNDPFQATAALLRDLRRMLAEDHVEFKETYEQLYQQVHGISVRIAEQCWKSEETTSFLSHRFAVSQQHVNSPFPRLRVAIDSEMKHFAASTNVQHAVTAVWCQGWSQFGSNSRRDSFRLLRHSLLYFPLSIAFTLTAARFPKSFWVPKARFVSSLSSYITFLTVLLAVTFFHAGSLDNRTSLWKRAGEVYVYSYVLGLTLDRFMEYWRTGSKFFARWWRCFDFFLLCVWNVLFYLYIACWLGIDERHAQMHRRHWSPTDLRMFYEALLCVGVAFANIRVFYFLQLNKTIGATVVSIGRCIFYLFNYVVIMFVVLTSYGIGLTMLSQPYDGAYQQNEDGSVTNTPDRFTKNTIWSVRSLYWGFFGYLDPTTYGPVVVGNAGRDQSAVQHTATNIALEAVTFSYYLFMVITILNLMISMLVKKADEVLDRESLEFKFTRVCIYSEYWELHNSVPPPLNLLFVPTVMLVDFFSKRMNKQSIKKQHYAATRIADTDDADAVDVKRGQLRREADGYMTLLKTMFDRFKYSKEYHYRTVHASALPSVNKFPPTKTAFMNSLD